MKEGHYTLLNEEYSRLVGRLGSTFDAKNIPYVVVGGAGVQTAIVDALTGNGRESILQKKHELLWLLRPTDDIDMAVRADRLQVGNALQELDLSDPSLTIDLPYSHGPTVHIRGREGVMKIHLNIETNKDEFKGLSQFYDEIIDNPMSATVHHNSHAPFTVYTAAPEFLVASKLTRSKSKDVVDITNLIRVLGVDKINRKRIEEILATCGKTSGRVTFDNILEDLRI